MFLKNEKLKKYCCFVGVHFITAPFSFIWVYGNLAEYIDSFVRYSGCDGCNDGDTQWILPLYMACFCPGLFLVHPLVKRTGLKCTGILAMLVFNSGLLGSAWTIQISVVGTIILQGLVMGMSVSVSVCISYMYIQSWRPKYEALLLSSVSCSANFLAMFENQLVTEVVNPSNLQPDKMNGPKTFFSQPEVLKRVPKTFLMLGGIITGLQTVGFLLVSVPSSKDHQNPNSIPNERKMLRPNAKCPDIVSNDHSQCHKDHAKIMSENHHYNFLSKERKDGSQSLTVDMSFEVESTGTADADTCNTKSHPNSKPDNASKTLTPAEILQTSGFWVLWLSWVALIYSLMLKNCFYKQFGFVYLRNDKALTLLGTFTPLVTSLARIALGYSMDKAIIGVEGSLVIGLSSCSLLCAFWFWAPQISGALYSFLILCLASMLSVFYVVFPTAILRMFGPTHFSFVLAMLYTGSTTVGLTFAVLATPVLHALGWFWVFISSSVLNLIALMYVIVAKINA
ncbi:hypothetical protein RRG08_040141 [Elysia crispata]|uniref:Uncharacterized protein n=1 Tax=Elysia crispata TaxID=231223 RepID=A0AAE1CNG0_9GAST|nr:hypothetical protein RRG08_040141 [Elysia crispata]